MKITRGSKIQGLILATALTIGLCFVFPVSAQLVQPERSFILDINGKTLTDLGTLVGGFTRATGINDAGQVVGYSIMYGGAEHAFITGPNGVGMTDLGPLDGGGYYGSEATDINDAGQVVGWSTTAENHLHAFITGPNGMGMTDLGTLGGDNSRAYAINDAGQAVGWAGTAAGEEHAFITGLNGEGMTDLNSLVELPVGIVLTSALDINNAGQVIVTAVIPEPQSYALMLAGLILAGFMVRRKSLST